MSDWAAPRTVPEDDLYPSRPVLGRRTLLRVGVVALVAGCRPRRRDAHRPEPAGPDPDRAVAARVRADETRLVAAYDTTLTRFPQLEAVLAPVRQQHAEHLAALAGPAGSASATASPAVPASARTAMRALVAAERAAAAARLVDCLAASPQLAPLVASIGASEAAHAGVLAGVRPR